MSHPDYKSLINERSQKKHSKWFALLTVVVLMVCIVSIVHYVPKSWFVKDLSNETISALPSSLKNEVIESSDNKQSVTNSVSDSHEKATRQPFNATTHANVQQLKKHFSQAVVMLHAKQYQFAINQLHEVLKIAPNMPEAHANMGYAMMGDNQFKSARDFFETAIELNPKQYNAYYGLALCYFQLGDRLQAIGAMESYLHRVPGSSYYEQGAKYLQEWRNQQGANLQEVNAGASTTPHK